MAEYVEAWQCTGCGRLEGAQPCIGACQDRRVALVHAADYEEALAAAARARAERDHFAALARQLAITTPRGSEWERTYCEMQRRAREALGIRPRPQPRDVDDARQPEPPRCATAR